MGNSKDYIGANDNTPAWAMDSQARELRPNPRFLRKPRTRNKTRPSISFKPLLAILPIVAILAGAAAWWFAIPTSQLIWPAVAIAGILFLVSLASTQSEQTRNLSALAIIGALTTALTGFASDIGISLFLTDIAVALSCCALCIAWIIKSRSALMLSVFSGLIWLASLHPEISEPLGLGVPATQGWLALFPILLIGQIALSMGFRSLGALFMTTLAGYGFAASLSTQLPLVALTGLTFAVAAAHHRLGKAWADVGVFGSRLHITIGWIAAVTAAIYLQSLWLNDEAGQAFPIWKPLQGWWIALGFAAMALFISSIVRYKHSQITLSGVFLVSTATIILPIASIRPDLVDSFFAAIPGLPARPSFALMIGAALIASSLAWIVNGLRKGQTMEMLLGIGLIGLQAMILLKPGLTNLDFGIVFIVSLIAALCVSGLIAGASLNHTPPARRYA